MMAHAWSVYTGRTGVCLVTAGPGLTNAITGIANAFLDNAPMVVLCGRHPLRDDLKGALQEIGQMDLVKPITKWAATCLDARRIPEYLSLAFRYAAEGSRDLSSSSFRPTSSTSRSRRTRFPPIPTGLPGTGSSPRRES